MTRRPTDVLYAVTAAATAEAFLKGQMKMMSQTDRVALVVGDQIPDELVELEGVDGFTISLSRQPSPAADALALGRLVRLIRRQRPRVAIFGTPKMGVLTSLATFACGTPRRVYVIHGFRWQGYKGWRRFLLTRLESLACLLATDVVAVSSSVRETAVNELGVASDKIRVLHHGSANGVDSLRFVPIRGEERSLVRRELGLPTTGQIFTFAGRLTRDKGIQDLPHVWRRVAAALPTSHLIVVGQAEPSSPEDVAAIATLRSMESVTVLPSMSNIEVLLGAADVNLSLSRREGLGMVILEAAACEVPTVAYEVTGTVDAVAPGTGALVPLDSRDEFVEEAITYGRDATVRLADGRAARARVERDFRPDDVWAAWVDLVGPASVAR